VKPSSNSQLEEKNISQKTTFRPKGIMGKLYSELSILSFIFGGMVKGIINYGKNK